jgi:hypothetical protein
MSFFIWAGLLAGLSVSGGFVWSRHQRMVAMCRDFGHAWEQGEMGDYPGLECARCGARPR